MLFWWRVIQTCTLILIPVLMNLWVHNILICTWPSLITDPIFLFTTSYYSHIHIWSHNVHYMYDWWLTADVFAIALKNLSGECLSANITKVTHNVMQLLFCTGGKRTDGLKAADIVPILRERVAYLSGIKNQIPKLSQISCFDFEFPNSR